MKKRLERVHSPQLGRSVSLWCYGHWGQPLVAFPTAAGFAHEWESQSMVEALSPWLDGGRIKLYCPESNVAEAWTRRENDPAWRIQRHMAYERFVVETLVPRVREDCASPGIGIGAKHKHFQHSKDNTLRQYCPRHLISLLEPMSGKQLKG